MKLFKLHARGKVLGKTWEGWKVKDDILWTPNNKWFKRTEMEIHEIVYDIASSCRRLHMNGNLLDEIVQLRKQGKR